MPSFKTASCDGDDALRLAKRTAAGHFEPALAQPAIAKADTEAKLPATIDTGGEILVASEAIVVLDIVQSTFLTNLFGWHSVGRVVIRDLRRLTREACAPHGLTSAKTAGDGLLLTFSNDKSAEMAVPSALAGMRTLLTKVTERNARAPEQQRFDVRVAVHFGEVDIIDSEREGPNVAFACRLEKVSRDSLPTALKPMDPRAFPTANYVLCSEAVAKVLDRIGNAASRNSCGLFKLDGFPGWSEVFLLDTGPEFRALPAPCGGA